MQKVICKRTYNTLSATCIKKYTHLCYGDPYGYEEVLYQTPDGLYFIYVNGGYASPYPQEDILRLAKSKVAEWLDSH